MRMYNTNVLLLLLLRHGEVGGRTSLVIELEENGAIYYSYIQSMLWGTTAVIRVNYTYLNSGGHPLYTCMLLSQTPTMK